ncbi:hypothetical protein B0T24DRAFT_600223 [Lasiosphaeria ovina]|uniref:Uncharacterized protein n=1 Tax=Lasiosphaeria ovina TaxID=92902 RepID=A0AAE0JRI3_9PEZI|nr:hypothetical protein B0T24DRAFT_600223 [Lasiosphaeria ovina]
MKSSPRETKAVVKRHLGKEDEPLLDPLGDDACKTNVGSQTATALRTYIKKASAWFRPRARQTKKITYIDAGFGYNNPSDETSVPAWGDIIRLDDHTVVERLSAKVRKPLAAVEAMKEHDHGGPKGRTGLLPSSLGVSSIRYHRFNVDHGLQDVELFEHKKRQEVEVDTEAYLNTLPQESRNHHLGKGADGGLDAMIDQFVNWQPALHPGTRLWNGAKVEALACLRNALVALFVVALLLVALLLVALPWRDGKSYKEIPLPHLPFPSLSPSQFSKHTPGSQLYSPFKITMSSSITYPDDGFQVLAKWSKRWQNLQGEHNMLIPTYENFSDRRGGRTAWSSAVTISSRRFEARHFYAGGEYMNNNAWEDAAEVALKSTFPELYNEILHNQAFVILCSSWIRSDCSYR